MNYKLAMYLCFSVAFATVCVMLFYIYSQGSNNGSNFFETPTSYPTSKLTQTYSNALFSFSYPVNWDIDDSDIQTVIAYKPEANVNFIVSHTTFTEEDRNEASLSQCKDLGYRVINNLNEDDYKSVELIDWNIGAVSGASTCQIAYEGSFLENEFIQAQYVFGSEETYYSLTLSALEDTSKIHELRAVVETFELL